MKPRIFCGGSLYSLTAVFRPQRTEQKCKVCHLTGGEPVDQISLSEELNS